MGSGKTEQMQLLTGLSVVAFANLRHECTVLNYTNEKVHALEIRLVLGTPELIYRSQNDGKVV